MFLTSDDGRVFTTASVSASAPAAVYRVERLVGESRAIEVATHFGIAQRYADRHDSSAFSVGIKELTTGITNLLHIRGTRSFAAPHWQVRFGEQPASGDHPGKALRIREPADVLTTVFRHIATVRAGLRHKPERMKEAADDKGTSDPRQY